MIKQPGVDYSIECICDTWLHSDGSLTSTDFSKRKNDPTEPGQRDGYDPGCPFHQKYPNVHYDSDIWALSN